MMESRVVNPKAVLESLELVDNRGYRVADIQNKFESDLYKNFCTWFTGQTGTVSNAGEMLIFDDDLERFLYGLDDAEWL